MSRQLVACVALLAFSASACVTTDVIHSTRQPPSESSRITVSAFRSPSAAHRNRPLETTVHSRLYRLEAGGPVLVQESEKGSWSVSDVSPGRYRIQVVEWQRPNGKVTHFRSPPTETFSVGLGEAVDVHVIQSDKRGWMWTAVGLVASGVAIDVLSRHTK